MLYSYVSVDVARSRTYYNAKGYYIVVHFNHKSASKSRIYPRTQWYTTNIRNLIRRIKQKQIIQKKNRYSWALHKPRDFVRIVAFLKRSLRYCVLYIQSAVGAAAGRWSARRRAFLCMWVIEVHNDVTLNIRNCFIVWYTTTMWCDACVHVICDAKIYIYIYTYVRLYVYMFIIIYIPTILITIIWFNFDSWIWNCIMFFCIDNFKIKCLCISIAGFCVYWERFLQLHICI